MNKILTEGPSGKLLVCILEPGNLHRLQKGEPIEINLNGPELFPAGLPAKLSIAIAYSETPIADSREIRKHLKDGGLHSDTRKSIVENLRPHCRECHSTVEQMGICKSDPIWFAFCSNCGSVLGAFPPIPGAVLEKAR